MMSGFDNQLGYIAKRSQSQDKKIKYFDLELWKLPWNNVTSAVFQNGTSPKSVQPFYRTL